VYTWREGSTPITTISAGRTLTWSIIP
jgi:hypothetical protein